MIRQLRTHQQALDTIVGAIAAGASPVRDILAAVTPGSGKSLLPVIAAARLIAAGVVDRVCWIVPRESLRLQAEEAFADPAWRGAIGHTISVRGADNGPDLCRGLQGYVTTYQAIAAAPDLHLAEIRRHRYLMVVDELHHLPALSDLDPFTAQEAETAWSRAVAPLLESAACRLLMSGTLQRADGRAILRLPYRRPRGFRRVREIDFEAPGWAVVGYSRRQALAERAIIPVTFGAVDGEAEWISGGARTRRVASWRMRACWRATPCSRPCAPSTPKPCCAWPLSTAADIAWRAGATLVSARGTSRWGWASCWWLHPTKHRHGATRPNFRTGRVRRTSCAWRSAVRRTRMARSRSFGCGPTRRCW
jgi:hypothetical protein